MCVQDSDLYDILGVDPSDTFKTIRRAYKEKSLQTHPDQGGSNAEFQRVQHAYEVLSDSDKRGVYDQHGHEGLERLKQQQHEESHDPFDFFNSMFGDGNVRRSRDEEEENKRGEDIEIEIQATLNDLYNGRVFEVNVRNQAICSKCFGSCAKSDKHIHKCSKCGGSGTIIQETILGPGFVTRSQSVCKQCGGKGTIIKAKCPHCKGKGVVSNEKTLTIFVEKGMKNKQKIVFENEADESPDVNPGHIIFNVIALRHSNFRRLGNDLHYDTRISLKQSLIGFNITIDQLDGRKLILNRTEITRPDQVIKIEGEGMPIYNSEHEAGNLYVHFKIDFPEGELTKEQKLGYEQLKIK